VFQGASALTLDAKGRMSIPARHREALQLQAEGRVTLTKHPDGCLMLFPRPEWERFRERIAALPMEAHWWKRIFLGSAADVELDTAGRVLVTPELRMAASLSGPRGSLPRSWVARFARASRGSIRRPAPFKLYGFTSIRSLKSSR
jgi:MraZ protein